MIGDRSGPAHPGVRFPPPLLFAAGLLTGLALDRWVFTIPIVGGESDRAPLTLLGWLVLVAGVAFAAWGMITFRRARTAIVPFRPARTVVASGPYRWSRNPMYVGLTALYAGLAVLLNAGWPLILLPLVLTALWFLVIRREERYLAHAFGDEYIRYQQRVRRWL
jgi:protein-S-isoprenylcysteine O-methyltransferase Ste14